MKKKFISDMTFLGGMGLLCIVLNIIAKKQKIVEGYTLRKLIAEIKENNENEKPSLEIIRMDGRGELRRKWGRDVDDSDLVNWASWEPNLRNDTKAEPAGSYDQKTNNEKKWG